MNLEGLRAIRPHIPRTLVESTRKTSFAGQTGETTLKTRQQQPALRDHAVHLEHLGVLAVHIDAVCPREVADVLLVRVAAVLL
jgi:hypothetical protein